MATFLRKPIEKISEDVDNIDKDTQDIVDADLQQKKAQLLKQKADKKAQFDKEMQRIDNQILQLYNQQTAKNKNAATQANNNTNQNQPQQNESLLEGKNSKQELLSVALKNVFNNIDASYALSNIEINRLARKINDVLNSHKNVKDLWQIVKFEIKKYLLNHNRISLSQSEINNLLNLLEKELQKREYKNFSYLFNTEIDTIKIKINNDTNIDELEALLSDLDFDIIEDLENNEIKLSNIDDYNIKQLKRVLKDFNLLKINYDLFF